MQRPQTGTFNPSVWSRACEWLAIAFVAGCFLSCGGGSGGSSGTGSAAGSGTTGGGSTTGSGGTGSTSSGGTAMGTAAFATHVLMHHNDLARTGQMLAETTLTLANVNSASFGKLRFLPADGKVDGQPLFVTNLTMGTGVHNVVYVVTEHDSIYAYDADSGAALWQISLAPAGESPSADVGCMDITPEIGITSTPVIDRSRGPNGVLYAVAMTTDG